MTRHLLPVSAAAFRTRKGDHLQIRSSAAGSQRDLTPGAARSAAPAGRARLTHFRRAILG